MLCCDNESTYSNKGTEILLSFDSFIRYVCFKTAFSLRFVITRALLCIENRFRSGDCMERKTNHFNDCDRSFLSTEKQTRKRKKKLN